jgi:hypothetical protein
MTARHYLDIEREWMRDLRSRPEDGWRDADEHGSYRIRVIGRGSLAFYEADERALLAEISAGEGWIARRWLARWDDDSMLTEAARDRVVARFLAFFRSIGHADPRELR